MAFLNRFFCSMKSTANKPMRYDTADVIPADFPSRIAGRDRPVPGTLWTAVKRCLIHGSVSQRSLSLSSRPLLRINMFFLFVSLFLSLSFCPSSRPMCRQKACKLTFTKSGGMGVQYRVCRWFDTSRRMVGWGSTFCCGRTGRPLICTPLFSLRCSHSSPRPLGSVHFAKFRGAQADTRRCEKQRKCSVFLFHPGRRQPARPRS